MHVFTNNNSDYKVRCHFLLINCDKRYAKYLEVAVFIEIESRLQNTRCSPTERIYVTFKIMGKCKQTFYLT